MQLYVKHRKYRESEFLKKINWLVLRVVRAFGVV